MAFDANDFHKLDIAPTIFSGISSDMKVSVSLLIPKSITANDLLARGISTVVPTIAFQITNQFSRATEVSFTEKWSGSKRGSLKYLDALGFLNAMNAKVAFTSKDTRPITFVMKEGGNCVITLNATDPETNIPTTRACEISPEITEALRLKVAGVISSLNDPLFVPHLCDLIIEKLFGAPKNITDGAPSQNGGMPDEFYE